MRKLERSLVAGLAATRLVRAWKYEEIGEKPRKAVLGWLAEPVMYRRRPNQVNVRATLGKKWLGDLLDCPHCFGFWLTVVTSLLIRRRRARFLIEALAGSMVLSWFVQWYPGFDFTEPDPADPLQVIVRDGGDE